ncbi:hypothetical protein ACJIZ3_024960 [Penstemon smallii]|uniref:Pentatricopeptide repeat-containing protein n=1 Tax=Penstemon smallii TaxID=265156 RepID=A0ABD3TTA4_9LAMI
MHLPISPAFTAKYRQATTTIKCLFSSSSLAAAVNEPCLSKHPDTVDPQLSLLRSTPPSRSAVLLWKNLIKRSIYFRDPKKALHLFDEMRRLGCIPDDTIYIFVLKASGELPSLKVAESVHLLAFVTGHINSNANVGNAAITMYGRCGAVCKAQQVFDEMLVRRLFDTVSWNAIIAVYEQSGEFRRALQMFQRMLRSNSSRGEAMRASEFSLGSAVSACASLQLWMSGMEIHGHALRRGLIENVVVANAIVEMYAKCGLMDEAKIVFDCIEKKDVVCYTTLVTGYSQIGKFDIALGLLEKMRENKIELNVVTWNAVIAGYAQMGLGYEALDMFRKMIASRYEPDPVTLTSVLTGCAAIGALAQGREIHGYVTKRLKLVGNDRVAEMMVINGLIDMYAKCENLKLARFMFDSRESKDREEGIWCTMICGCVQNGEANDALGLFSEMLQLMMPSVHTISCALTACARIGDLRHGREIHAYALRNHYEDYKDDVLFLSNSLIEMYARSRHVKVARCVFDSIESKDWAVVTWTNMINGYVLNGKPYDALELFCRMLRTMMPSEFTISCALMACAHIGDLRHGREIHAYALRNHYNLYEDAMVCVSNRLIDMYVRCGDVNAARALFVNTTHKEEVSCYQALFDNPLY